MKDTERRNIMGFIFTVTFDHLGNVLELEHGKGPKNFPADFRPAGHNFPELKGLKAWQIDAQTFPIDLTLTILAKDKDPCITHKGRRY
jgi:hypothetical protein